MQALSLTIEDMYEIAADTLYQLFASDEEIEQLKQRWWAMIADLANVKEYASSGISRIRSRSTREAEEADMSSLYTM